MTLTETDYCPHTGDVPVVDSREWAFRDRVARLRRDIVAGRATGGLVVMMMAPAEARTAAELDHAAAVEGGVIAVAYLGGRGVPVFLTHRFLLSRGG